MIRLLTWLIGSLVNTLVAVTPPREEAQSPQRKRTGVDIFVEDILRRIKHQDASSLPRQHSLTDFVVITDRGVADPLVQEAARRGVQIQNECEFGSVGPLEYIRDYFRTFQDMERSPTTTCLIYAVQDRAHVEILEMIHQSYPDLAIVVVMLSLDDENVMQVRNLHAAGTVRELLVLDHFVEDAQTFIEEILPHLYQFLERTPQQP